MAQGQRPTFPLTYSTRTRNRGIIEEHTALASVDLSTLRDLSSLASRTLHFWFRYMHPGIVVLLVEDEPLILLNTAEMLADAGFAVLEATSASEAFTLLEGCPLVKIIFTDINLADDENGLELLRAVAQRWPPIHLFATSGGVVPKSEQLPAGARFFAKPYRPSEVISAFDAAL